MAPTQSKLLFVKMTAQAMSPSKGSKLSAGYDLKAAYDGMVPKRGSALIKTDLQIQLPTGTYGRVAPRSGLALKNKIDVGAGVIDEDYRGNVGVVLFNHSDEDFAVSRGDRIAQLICQKIEYPEIEEVQDLESTQRGEKGFGSTGLGAGEAMATTNGEIVTETAMAAEVEEVKAPATVEVATTNGHGEPEVVEEAMPEDKKLPATEVLESEAKKARMETEEVGTVVVNAVSTVTTTTVKDVVAEEPAATIETEAVVITAAADLAPAPEEVEMAEVVV